MDKMTVFAKEVLAKKEFDKPNALLENMVKLVSRSSMVSLFEKPKFRDMVNDLNSDDRVRLVSSYKKLFHGNQKKGLAEVVEFLAEEEDGQMERNYNRLGVLPAAERSLCEADDR